MSKALRVRTACPLDCFDTCGMVATVVDGRVTKLEGDVDHPITRGFLCSKGRRLVDRTYDPNRVTSPLMRVEGQWTKVSWDRALDSLADALLRAKAEYGSISAFYNWDAGSMGLLKSIDQRFWNAYGGATLPSGSLCSSAGISALVTHYGAYSSNDPLDIPNTKFMILWGRNPAVTNIHMLPLIKEAKARGARIILIDPVRTSTAGIADVVISPRPGTDGALALGIASVIIDEGLVDEEFVGRHVHGYAEYARHVRDMNAHKASGITGVAEETIRSIAMEYATTRPASIWVGFGVQRHAGGGGAVRAIDALSAITGNVGIAGGGTNYSHRNTKRTKPVDARNLAKQHRWVPRAVLGSGLLGMTDPPVKVAVIARSNPLCQNPNSAAVREAFGRIPTVALVDHFLTDTSEIADIFLPCTTFLEEEDVYLSYFHNFVSYGPKLVDAVGEARSDYEILQGLAERLGFGKYFKRTSSEWLACMLEPFQDDGITLDTLRAHGSIRDPRAPFVAWEDRVFATPSGRIELASDSQNSSTAYFVEPAESPDSDYPFTLLSTQPRNSTHSQFNFPGREARYPVVYIPQRGAIDKGIAQGDSVEVWSRRGRARFTAAIKPELRDDVLLTFNGHWASEGGGVNCLTGEHLSDIGLQAAFYDCACNIRRIT